MYRVRIVENHGHNGDDISWEDFQNYEDAVNYVLNYYFDGDKDKMKNAEEDIDEWFCEDCDTSITIS